MAIESTVLKTEYQPWGVDVTVGFYGDGVRTTKTFRFVDSNEVTDELDDRIAKAKINLANTQEILDKPMEADMIHNLDRYFETYDSLSRTDYERLKAARGVVL